MKKVAEKKEEDDGYADAMFAIRRMQSRRRHLITQNALQQNSQEMTLLSPNLPRPSLFSSNNLEFRASILQGSHDRQGSIGMKRLSDKRRISGKMLIESMMYAPLQGVTSEETGTNLKRFNRRGHMPPIIRRASYYERTQDILLEQDSFAEDDSKSGDSTQSNYTNQDYHT